MSIMKEAKGKVSCCSPIHNVILHILRLQPRLEPERWSLTDTQDFSLMTSTCLTSEFFSFVTQTPWQMRRLPCRTWTWTAAAVAEGRRTNGRAPPASLSLEAGLTWPKSAEVMLILMSRTVRYRTCHLKPRTLHINPK
jgi:hypothetical protein